MPIFPLSPKRYLSTLKHMLSLCLHLTLWPHRSQTNEAILHPGYERDNATSPFFFFLNGTILLRSRKSVLISGQVIGSNRGKGNVRSAILISWSKRGEGIIASVMFYYVQYLITIFGTMYYHYYLML